jgi:protein ImuB
MRCLALHFPWLARDCAIRERPELRGRSVVFVERVGARDVVQACSPEAEDAGAEEGMPLDQALARVDRLAVCQSDPAAEAGALRSLAWWALGVLSPRVAIDVENNSLLVDLAGTQRLHGDEGPLTNRVVAALARRGYTIQSARADAPAVALALARFGDAKDSVLPPRAGRTSIRDCVGPLSTLCLPLDPRTAETVLRRLDALGITCVEHFERLPREALPSRLGHQALAALDTVLGRRELPLTWERLPDSFEERCEAPDVTRQVDLARICEELIERVVAQLEDAGYVARCFTVTLEQDAQKHVLELALAEPTRSKALIQRVLDEHLDHLSLRSGDPVTAVRFVCHELESNDALQVDLFTTREQANDGVLAALLTRWELRYGARCVYCLSPTSDPRPECSFLRHRAATRRWSDAPSDSYCSSRPTTLFERPRPTLPPRDRVGPQRLTTAWWQNGIDRDYYVTGQDGIALWVFQDRATRSWYVHGAFS